jgi:hypothetical protein
MKYVIEIHEVDVAPTEWNLKKSWPHLGLFTVKNETYSLYHVTNESENVAFISYPDLFKRTPYVETGEAVSESLLLKAIAAAAHAKVLS